MSPRPPLSEQAPAPRDETVIRDRGDACPGALRLHPADDGFLARLRLPGGMLTACQVAVLADAADRLGDARLSITSRGNVELRGLGDGCGSELAELLRGAGLLPSEQHERVRNVLVSPLAGLDGRGSADVHVWARELDTLLCATPKAAALSGRFLFALDDGRGDVAALGADVTLVAAGAGSAELWAGSADADHQVVRVAGADAPRAALHTALAFLKAVWDSGTGAWRVRELPAEHALSARTVAAGLTANGIDAALGARGVRPTPPPGGPAPGIIEAPDGPDSRHRTAALSVLAPLGRLTAAQARLLAATAARHGSGELRVTPWRGVVLPGLSREDAAPRLRELASAGLVTDPASPWYGVGACTGRPGCAKSRSDVRADAAAARTEGGGLPVYWSGCERRCGHPHGQWVDVLATGDGYRVSVRGLDDPVTTGPTTPTTPAELADAVTTARAATRASTRATT
ncbi:precorrin-3B synthase [Streptomyces sp. MST-110588]|uniref:precorrin-3B synthase n=1 Tax=Streptomyces sp. MST-110588 TaxID=2833628 RepID=UPI001F5C6E5D|nr:precorrin-3B synthase [Streptomyces sp. MST-110588]